MWLWLVVSVVLAAGAVLLQVRNMGNVLSGRALSNTGSFLRTGALTALLGLGAATSFVVFLVTLIKG